VNSSHFMHRSPTMDLGCTANFSYNIKHAHLLPTSAHSSSMGCQDRQFSSSVHANEGSQQESKVKSSTWSDLNGQGAQSVAFLFDTGVPRAIHGHFMSKLMQLWALSHSGTIVSHVVLFRGGFRNAAKSSMSKAQQQLLQVVVEGIERKQRKSFKDARVIVDKNSTFDGREIPMIWADDIAHTTGPLRSLCLGHATIGTGYENLVGSSEAADSFRTLLGEMVPSQSSQIRSSTTDLPPINHTSTTHMRSNSDGNSCPLPRVVLLHRGHGSTAPRRVINVEAVRDALSAAAAELGITLPPLVELEADGRSSLEEQVELFRSFGLLLSSHSSALKNLIFAAPHAAVVEVQPTFFMTNVFSIDVYHFSVHYEISKGHAPVGCGMAREAIVAGNASTRADHFRGVIYDASHKIWRSLIEIENRNSTLEFFKSPEAAAWKHDVVAVSIGRGALNFPREAFKWSHLRYAWKCNLELDPNLLKASLVAVLKQQQGHCPELWRGRPFEVA